jgi:hypothetical protein
MRIPQLQIRQTYGRIKLETQPGRLEIRQPPAALKIEQHPAVQQIRQLKGELNVDQSRAWDALGIGGHLKLMDHIYAGAKSVALEAIGRIAEAGDRLADISNPVDPIPQLAQARMIPFFEFEPPVTPSYDNIDILYTAKQPEIQVQQGGVDVDVMPRKPEIDYQWGRVIAGMLQYPSIEMWV